MSFVGKWKLTTQENFDDYMKAIGNCIFEKIVDYSFELPFLKCDRGRRQYDFFTARLIKLAKSRGNILKVKSLIFSADIMNILLKSGKLILSTLFSFPIFVQVSAWLTGTIFFPFSQFSFHRHDWWHISHPLFFSCLTECWPKQPLHK